MSRIFLLSPANLSGVRGLRILSGASRFDFNQGVAIGEIFTYISGLYFRGKLAYAEAFGAPPPLIITAGLGLLPVDARVDFDQLKQMAGVPIDAGNSHYRDPLERDARLLDPSAEIVLLGSLATPKYIEPLLGIVGRRLLCPAEFVGLGDMSRGGLMLQSVRLRRELKYCPACALAHESPAPAPTPQ